LRRSALLQEGVEQTDGQLLDRFVGGRDRLALEALVCRHAPMVWGVCRRTLAHHDQAEDAFQATFLVLVRKAASIRSPELLPNWLYRVAHKTACKARQTAAKRAARESQVRVLPEPLPVGPPAGEFGPELPAVLDEELSRLPEKYRLALVLCDLEGRSRAEAARQLRLPEGTVASRLARGRARLARRLARRGVTASATSLAAACSQKAASGAVPAALLANTVEAAGLLAAGEAVTAGLVSAGVPPLAEGVLHAMATKQKAGVVFLAAALVLAGGVVTYHTLAGPPAQPAPPPPTPEAVAREPAIEDFGNEAGAIGVLENEISRLARDGQFGTRGSRLRDRLIALPGWEKKKARLDRKSGHWFVTRNDWIAQGGLARPTGATVIAKYQPSEHSWKRVWFWRHRPPHFNPFRPIPPGYGWLPYPAKRHEGRTVKEWADGLEELDPAIIDRSGRGVQAFGDDGVPYLIVQARKHPPGAEHRRLIAPFIHVPAGGEWRQAAIDFLHELLNDPAQPTRDAARKALKRAGLE
jgi:RNA polymerase sigma factor (sigma-70 family)